MQVQAIIDTLPHQKEFAENLTDKYIALVGGFGSGKSFGSVLRTMNLIKHRNPNGLILFISPTFTLANDVNIPDFVEFLDKYKIPYKYKSQEKKIILTGKLKGQIWFRSGERPEKIVGFDATDFVLDEFDILRPQQQEVLWNKAIARIRGCDNSTGAITTTPEGFKKTYKLFEEEKAGVLIKAKTRDNIFLPNDYIDSLFEQYDEQLVKQYLEGEFVNINGSAAYYAFNRSILENFTVNSRQIYVGMDFNVNPMCAIFSAFYQNKLYIFDEAYLKNSNTQRMAEYIKTKFENYDITVCPDMTGIRKTTSSTASKSDIDILKQFGYRIRGTHNPFVRDRLNAVNNALSKRQIVIHPRCVKLIQDLEQVILDKYGEIDKGNMDLTHISDALGYLVWQHFPIRLYNSAVRKAHRKHE